MAQVNSRVFFTLRPNDEFVSSWGYIVDQYDENQYVVQLYKTLVTHHDLVNMGLESNYSSHNTIKRRRKKILYSYNYIMIHIDDIQLMLNPCDPNCPDCKNHIFHDFIDMWREDWEKLCFRRVDRVVTDSSKLMALNYVKIDDDDHLVDIEINVDSINDVPPKYRKTVYGYYSEYYGFVSRNSLNDDPYKGEEVYFGTINHTKLDFNFKMSGNFSQSEHHNICFIPPRPRDIIAGSISKRDDGKYFFSKWFVSSPEFFKLYLYVMNKKNMWMTGISTVEDIEKQLTPVSWTSNYNNATNDEELMEALHRVRLNYEYLSYGWSDIYKCLAYFYVGDIEKALSCTIPNNFLGTFLKYTHQRVIENRQH